MLKTSRPHNLGLPVTAKSLVGSFQRLAELPKGIHGEGGWVKTSENFVAPSSEGQEVDVFTSKENSEWHRISARPRVSFTGTEYPALTMLVETTDVANILVKKFRDGALGSPRPYSEALALKNLLEYDHAH